VVTGGSTDWELLADGCNEVLAMKGGSLLVNPDLL
jgi:hypothetical protein